MTLRRSNRLKKTGQVPNNEVSSQVFGDPVEPVQSLGRLGEDLSLPQDDDSLLKPYASHPQTSPSSSPSTSPSTSLASKTVSSPLRTAKHKQHNTRRLSSITNKPSNNYDYLNFNCRVTLENLMFSPLAIEVDENSSLLNRKQDSSSIESLTSLCGDGSSKHISACKDLYKKCKIKKLFIPADRVVSTVTKRVYDVVVAPGETKINCHSVNLIYLLTCDNCAIQYIGETVTQLSERMSHHFSTLREGVSKCKRLCEHYTSGLCKDSTFTIRILEKLEGTGRLGTAKRGPQDPTNKNKRTAREKHWILKLRTVFPFGLNDKLGAESKVDESTPISSVFPKLFRSSRGIRGIKMNNNMRTDEHFFETLDNILENNIKNATNFIRAFLFSSKKSVLKSIYCNLAEKLADSSNRHQQWYEIANDIIISKVFYKEPVAKKKKRIDPSNMLKLEFLNKGLEAINLPKLLHDPSLDLEFPHLITKSKYLAPTVIYKLSTTIRSNIFNYKKFISELDLNQFVNKQDSIPCNCAGSPFIDDFHGHVVSGNLDIVPNPELHALFLKGPQYREPKTIDFDAVMIEIKNGLKVLIDKWRKKYSVSVKHFDSWKNAFLRLVLNRITLLKKSMKIKPCSSTFDKKNVKCCLKDLHANYVITPIDKAANNVAFICKRFYVQTLVKELGISSSNTDQTYEAIKLTEDQIIKKHTKDIKKLFKIDVTETMSVLPEMHWTPKMHKTPSKARFIVAASKCTTKELAKDMTSVLKLFYRQIENYHAVAHKMSHIKHFWIVKNKDPVIDSLNRLSSKNRAKSIATYDFSTLYTKIPHDKLLSVFKEITDFCFNGCANSKILINDSYARWCHNPEKSTNSKKRLWDKGTVNKSLAYLLDNCYFAVGKNVYKQVIGIPMGTDPAPFMANLFLYYYEDKFMKELKSKDKKSASKFGHFWRYIDDLNAVNNDNIFESNIPNIYPSELELKKENDGYLNATFLDLDIKINDKKFSLKLYDKRDDFGFSIVRMPFASNNMPSSIFYSSFCSELLRIGRCTTGKDDFYSSSEQLLKRMYKQNEENENKMNRITNCLNKLYTKHLDIFNKFFDTEKQLFDQFLVNVRK